MHKRDITYTNFNGETVTETFYFHMSQAELTKLQYSTKEGFAEGLQRIVKDQDHSQILATFDFFILNSYGVKSEDGREFTKSPELQEKFLHSAAYDALFIELSSDDKKFEAFIEAVFPQNLSVAMTEATKQRPAVSTPYSGPGAPLAVPPPPTQS